MVLRPQHTDTVMESVHKLLGAASDTTPMAAILVLVVTICAVSLWAWRSKAGKRKEAPQMAGAWPIIGHLPFLASSKLLHRVFGELADKYGPVFSIRMGAHKALLVSSWEVAKECYTTNDKVFASRPNFIASEIIGHNYANFAFAPYGPYWVELRKIIMSELLSHRRLDLLKHVRDSEIDASMKELYMMCSDGKGTAVVEMKKWFGDLNLNVILRMIAGKRYSSATSAADESEAERWRTAMRDFMRLMGAFVPEDSLPSLRWFDLQGYKKEMRHTINELDSLFQGWLQEHKTKKLAGEIKSDSDFMYVMMSSLADAKMTYHDNDTIIKATCLSIISGGTDTTMLSLTWMLCLLLNNRRVLKKAQEELDNVVGRDRRVEESDIKNLVYLQAIVKETLRLYPAAPLSGPRQAADDCTVAGYHVPAGTRLMVNLWKLQRDPSVWSEPNEFRPERFLTDHPDMDVKGQDYELIPFATGRRMCPGIAFALQMMPLVTAHVLHGFELTTPNDEPVDMAETGGTTNDKVMPMEVVITPRIRPELYGL